MKKLITCLIASSVFFTHAPLQADGLEQFQKETNLLWSPDEKGEKDTSQDAQISTSMLTWGIALAVIIGVVFGLIKSYKPTSTTSTTT